MMTPTTTSTALAHQPKTRPNMQTKPLKNIMNVVLLCLALLQTRVSSVNAVPVNASGPNFVSTARGMSSDSDSDSDDASLLQPNPISIPSQCTIHNHTTRYDPLACWLQSLRVKLPDQKFRSGIVTVGIHDLLCTNFSIQGVDSSYRPSTFSSDKNETRTDPVMEIAVYNISAVCHGGYSSTGLSGQLSAAVAGNNPAVEWTTAVHSSTNNTARVQMAESVSTVDCQTDLTVAALHFTGSMSAKLIDLFSSQIARYVSGEINGQVCPVLVQYADPALTETLQSINRFLGPYLSPPTTGNETANNAVYETASSSQVQIERHLLRQHAQSPVSFLQRNEGDSSLVDLSTEASALVSTLQTVNSFVETYLHAGFLRHWFSAASDSDSDCNDHCDFFFDGVNGVLRSLLKDSDGKLHVPIPAKLHHVHFVWPEYGAIELQILTVTVSGVDQWEKLTLLRPANTRDFVSIVRTLDLLQLQANVKVIVTPIPGGMFQGDTLKESFQVHLNASALDALGNLSLEMDRSSFQNVTVSSIIDVVQGLLSHNASDQLSCLLEPIQDLQVTDFSARMHLNGAAFVPLSRTKMKDSTVVGKLEQDLDALLNNFLQLFLKEYQPLVTNSIYGLSRGPAKNALNVFLTNATQPKVPCPGPSTDHAHPHLVNFTKVEPLERLNSFLEMPQTLQQMNQYLDCTSGFLSHALKKLLSALLSTEFAGLAVRVSDVQIKNVGNIRQLKLLAPEGDGMHLDNLFDYGTTDDFNRPLMSVAADISYPPLDFSASINMTTMLNDVKVRGGSILHYDTNLLRQMSLAQLVSHGQCGLVPVNEYESYRAQSSIARFRTTVKARVVNGSSKPVNIVIDSDRYPSAESLVSAILGWAVNSTRDLTEVAFISTLSHAEIMCNGQSREYSASGDDDDNSQNYGLIFLIVLAIFLLAQPGILLIMRVGENEDNDDDQNGLLESLMSPGYLQHMDATDAVDSVDEEPLSTQREALMHSSRIPELARLLIPMLIVGCIVLLLSSNLSMGATVKLTVSMDDSEILSLPSLFAFSLYNTGKEMLQAEIYPLFLLIVVFSGIWPYAKLGLMLFAWSAPKMRLGTDRRGSLLLALDSLGKFSLVDTYVLVLMMVAFRYHLDLSEDTAIDVYVVPKFGFFGFLLATSASLVAGHVLVYYHRRSEIHLVTESTPAEQLCEHAFELDDDNRQLSRRFQLILGAILFATFVLLSVGITQESFVFEFDGLAGMALGDASRSSYSLLSLGSSLRQSAEDSSDLGILGLQIAYYFYAVVTPFCCLFCLSILIIFPMPLKRQLFLLTLAEISNAWSAVEVFAISIVAALLEISTFASFIIGHRCDFIKDILKEYSDTGMTCYTVRSFVAGNAVFLVTGVMLYSFIVSTLLGLAHTAVNERVRLYSIKEGPVDQLLTSGNHRPHTWVQRLSVRWPEFTRWIWRDDSDSVNLSRISDGPPIQGGDSIPSPWQKKDAFEDEWKEAAERDPAWKEWKEATQVT